MEEIGYVLSGSSQKDISFVVKEDKKVLVNHYYFITHPLKLDNPTYVLIRVYRVSPYNPEMSCGRPGPVAGKKGEKMRYGKLLEYEIARAETLGYFDEKGWRSLECSPGTWDPVFEPTQQEIEQFFNMAFKLQRGLQPYLIRIGYHKDTKIPVYLDLNHLTKGHLFVAGMTRSGKSSFMVNLVKKSLGLNPRPHIVIMDKRGEYSPLTKYGALVVPYYKFLSRERALTDGYISSKLGLNPKSPAGRLLMDAIETLRVEGKDVNSESLWDKVQSLAPISLSRDRVRILEKIRWLISMKGDFLNRRWNTLDVVDAILKNPILIIDFSVDANINNQLATVKDIVGRVVKYAISRRDEGDFAVIFVVEEIQYYAPERGLNIEVGNPDQIGTSKQLVEAISQAGGYNVGFIVLSQRPAYVLKSVISQCNTIACFRLMSGNDQEAILKYTEYGNERLREYLPCLADHEALVWGLASPVPFPVWTRIEVREFPRKAGVTAEKAWAKMNSLTAWSGAARIRTGVP